MNAPLKLRAGQLLLMLLGAASAASAQVSGVITSYIPQPSGNQTAVQSGTPISFPATNVNNTATATFIVTNTGTTPVTVNAATITGSAFSISGLPLLPSTLPPGNNSLQFTIRYTPTTRGSSTGSLTVDVGSARLTFPLVGQGTGASLTYSMQVGANGTQTIAPGGQMAFPSTALGSTAVALVKVTNQGDASASVSSINLTGPAYKLSGVPPLPATLLPGNGISFNVSFAPTTAGPANGALSIDGVSFELSGSGVGSDLSYSAVVGSVTTSLQNGGTASFPNTNIGASTTMLVVISNNGNAPAAVSGISVSGTGFSIPKLPQLPAQIPAGGSLQFQVAYTPTTTAPVTGVLQIDGFGINLRGFGNAPPPLTKLVFNNLAASANALDQPLLSVSLADPYPLDVTGKVTLSFTSDSFADDPNIQFATGGRTVTFTIPANTKDAVFQGGARSVQFQAGTVAGAINLVASMSAGAIDLTPTPAPSQSVLVVAGAPLIRNVQIGARTATSFEVLVTGLSTPRQVGQMTLNFTPATGANLQTNSLSVNTDAPFATWFQSSSGISFGSQFTATITVNVAGDINAIQSVSVQASNSRGNSNTVSASLR